ncbi:MAG: hypothetical protein ABIT83_03560 [Massilia sp.]
MLPKQLFYVTQDQLCACQWRRGRLGEPVRFGADAAGLAAFGAYLDAHADTPAYLVADLVEEDFQRLSLPHVGGRAGRGLVARRLRQLYRDTPYRQARVQGREVAGRRDDLWLFSALTNPASVQPWVDALEQRRVPLAALYSAAFLSQLLVRRLAAPQPHLLLITRQSGGLRQSYFQAGALKFSRLTELAEHDDLATHTAAETARMQQFLTSTRLLGRGDLLRVLVVAPADSVAALESLCFDGHETAFDFIDLDSAGARFKLAQPSVVSDQLLLALAARQTPPSHYPLGSQARFHRLWSTRMSLYAASAALACGALLWVGADLWQLGQDEASEARMRREAADYTRRYQAIMTSLPPTATRTANMKAAVQLDSMLRAQAPEPAPLMALLSDALERNPAINLMALEWSLAQPPAAGAAGSSDTTAPVTASSLGIPQPPIQALVVEGDVGAPTASYRSVLESVNRLVLDLRAHPQLAVEVVATPLDVRPDVRLTGKAGLNEPADKPKFILKLSWRP